MSGDKPEKPGFESDISGVPVLRQKPSQADVASSSDGHPPHSDEVEPKAVGGRHGREHQYRKPHHDAVKGRKKKHLKRTVLLRAPLADDEGPWVKSEHEATEWLSLFYDLVVVAVLTVFSTAHELSNPKAIPAFFSYFVIIYWIWVSQTHYDTRYQSNDAMHILMKFCQICVFIYIGAASGNWAPAKLPHVPTLRVFDEDGHETHSSTEAEEVQESFKTVVLAYLASRVLLALQYGLCAWLGSRAGRRTKNFWLSIGVLLVSAALAIAAVVIPIETMSQAIAKARPAFIDVAGRISLFYLGMLIEIVLFFVQIYLNWHVSAASHKVTERYGAFTLILLGEGFIALTRAFKQGISGLSDRDTGMYAQVFLSIMIMYLLWGFLFSRFDKEDEVSHRRRLAWEIVHFPLAFGLLLLFGSMVNTVLVVASSSGTTMVLEGFGTFLDQAITGQLTTFNSRRASRYLEKLTLQPTWEVEVVNLRELALDDNPSQNASIVAIQYFAQIVIQAIKTYGLEVDEHVEDLYDELNAVNNTQTNNQTHMDETLMESVHLVTELVNESFDDLLSGVQWLMPVAGIVLLICAVRSTVWYRFHGPGHFVIHGFQIGAGIILGLLGLLNIGSKHGDFAAIGDDVNPDQLGSVNPMYKLTLLGLPLVIVMLVYLITYLGSTAAMVCLHRRKGGVYGVDDDEMEEGEGARLHHA